MNSANGEKQALKAKWLKLLNSAFEWDTWGQVVEAAEAYDK